MMVFVAVLCGAGALFLITLAVVAEVQELRQKHPPGLGGKQVIGKSEK